MHASMSKVYSNLLSYLMDNAKLGELGVIQIIALCFPKDWDWEIFSNITFIMRYCVLNLGSQVELRQIVCEKGRVKLSIVK